MWDRSRAVSGKPSCQALCPRPTLRLGNEKFKEVGRGRCGGRGLMAESGPSRLVLELLRAAIFFLRQASIETFDIGVCCHDASVMVGPFRQHFLVLELLQALALVNSFLDRRCSALEEVEILGHFEF